MGLSQPKIGDLVDFDWQKNGWNDQIGIVEKVNGNHITIIEGSLQRLVTIRVCQYNDWRIAGYARPKYKTSETTPQKGLSMDALASEVITGMWGKVMCEKCLEQAG